MSVDGFIEVMVTLIIGGTILTPVVFTVAAVREKQRITIDKETNAFYSEEE